MKNLTKTFDIFFDNQDSSNNKGFKESYDFCKSYIETYNGSNNSYFADYKGGSVRIVCNETGETEFETEVL